MKKMKLSAVFLISLLALASCHTSSHLQLPSLIGDNMLLQQKTNVKIWGKANPHCKIIVSASWNALNKTVAGKDGYWSVNLYTPEAGGPYTISISSSDTTITINNVLIGEVWFCSGQSNMEMPLSGWPPNDTIMYSKSTIASAAMPEIRLFNVHRKISCEPLSECSGKWEVCDPSTVSSFSATAYFFGKKLYDELKTPVGLIESAWGGTPSESWTSAESLDSTGEFSSNIKALKESVSILADYQTWLNTHKQVDIKPEGSEQWKGLGFNDEKIIQPTFIDTYWPLLELPTHLEKATGEFDGVVWFRKTFEVPENMTAKDMILSLGPIDDMDRTYFNGTLIGSVEEQGRWQMDRYYEIPASIVRAGANTISVRVVDIQGNGGFNCSPEKMSLILKNDKNCRFNLSGPWRYMPVAEFRDSKIYLFNIGENDFFSKNRPTGIGPGTPSVLFNGMVSPLLSYIIKGAIWYQGEANVGRAEQYKKIFPAMIQNWREAWKIKFFPFYFVQIAPFEYKGVDSTESAYLREAQESALELPKTGMAITLDIATVMNIHPPFKKEVGERLALLALNNEYGKSFNINNPVYKSMLVEGRVAKLKFANTGDGLVSKDSLLKEFEIAGKDGRYIKATARILNDEVLVSSPKITAPFSVRYCWRNGAKASLFNKAGMAALQFRTSRFD